MPFTRAAKPERADPGERGLPERDLPGPTGEHDERQRDQREQQHVRVQEVARRRGDHERHGDRDDERQRSHDAREHANPPDRAQPFGDRFAARRERERRVVVAIRVPRDQPRRDQHDDEQQPVEHAGLGRACCT